MEQTTNEQKHQTECSGADGDGIVRGRGKIGLETKIFRYLPVDRYLELVEDGYNALTHLTLWEDPYEAFILRAGVTYRNGESREDIYNVFKNVYGQSWTIREEESDVIWRAMGKRGELVRIQTRVGKLADSLRLSGDTRRREHFRIAPVSYLPNHKFNAHFVGEELDLAIKGDVDDKMNFFFMKREEFSLEEEVRVIAIPDENELDKKKCTKGHLLKFPIESVDFIEEVVADPMMDRRKYEQMVCRTRHVSQQIKVGMSNLFVWPTIHDSDVGIPSGGQVSTGDIPDGEQFYQHLLNERKSEGNIRAILCRVRRVFGHAPHGALHVTFEELQAMLDTMDAIVPNQGSADDCRVAIRHYMKAMYGHDDREE